MYQSSPRANMLPEPDRNGPLQDEYRQPVEQICRQFSRVLGKNLVSVYATGSVAWRRAVWSRSDIDLLVVTRIGLSSQQKSSFQSLCYQMVRSKPEWVDIDVTLITVGDIADLGNLLRWGFLLKHAAVRVHGDELSTSFGHFVPSWDIAKAVRGDVKGRYAVLRRKMATATQWKTQLDAAEESAKLCIRSAYGLVFHREKRWIENPTECAKALVKYYPEQEQVFERLLLVVDRLPVKKRAVVTMLDSAFGWIESETGKIDRRIG
ncbi:hypothetical protein NF212_07925 [Parasalinivibrio latis]|uniref:hypothetical protein n=1 Tax=Parasalinivibrio latis TaxID=2952610 RepID=UPI0030E57DF1